MFEQLRLRRRGKRFEKLMTVLLHGEEADCLRAVEELCGLGNPWTTDGLVRTVIEREERKGPGVLSRAMRIRERIVEALQDLGGEYAVDKLIELFRDVDANPRDRVWAARMLGRVRTTRAIPPFRDYLCNSILFRSRDDGAGPWGSGLEGTLIDVLGELGETKWGQWFSASRKHIQGGRNVIFSSFLANMCASSDPEALEVLMAGFRGKSQEFSWVCARVMAKYGCRDAIEPLLLAKHKADPDGHTDLILYWLGHKIDPERVLTFLRFSGVLCEDVFRRLIEEDHLQVILDGWCREWSDVASKVVKELAAKNDKRMVKLLLVLLRSARSGEARELAVLLARLGQPQWLQCFLGAGPLGADRFREEVVYLVTCSAPEAIPMLCQRLGHASLAQANCYYDPEHLDGLAQVLDALGDRWNIASAVRVLQDSSIRLEIRVCAARVLGKSGDRRAIVPLRRVLMWKDARSWSIPVDDIIREALSSLGAPETPDPSERHLIDEVVGRSPIDGLFYPGPWAIDSLTELIRGYTWDLGAKEMAVPLLVEMDDPRVIPGLIAALDFRWGPVSGPAATALGFRNDDRAVKPLIDTMKYGKEDTLDGTIVRELAARSLLRLAASGSTEVRASWDEIRQIAETHGLSFPKDPPGRLNSD